MNDDTAAPSVGELPHAYGAPPVRGVIRREPDDFRVDEELGFTPSGAGEHVLLHIRKRGLNTDDVTRLLARHAGVALRDVSYAGLKDRHAVTSQWFSVTLPGKAAPDWSALNGERVTVLAAARHARKLRRGALTGNRFTLLVRELDGDVAALVERLRQVAAEGVPNYFGDQRFGRDNVERARRMLAGRLRVRDRFERGIYLSALRSLLFNAVLARRVADGSWRQALAGDALVLAGSRSFFVADDIDEALRARVAAHDVHPSGPLWGEGELASRAAARQLEEEALQAYRADAEALARSGLAMERRPLRLRPQALEFDCSEPGCLRIGFGLGAGGYATVVLRELVAPAG